VDLEETNPLSGTFCAYRAAPPDCVAVPRLRRAGGYSFPTLRLNFLRQFILPGTQTPGAACSGPIGGNPETNNFTVKDTILLKLRI